VVIGYEQSEQLDVEPARFFVVATKREKRACKGCAEGVKTAALPARIIDKSLVSDRVVIDALVSKYCDHLPLYRQSAILKRETGVTISRATMDGWVMTVGGLLGPIKAAMGRELIVAGYIQADETPVPVQTHDNSGKNHQAYLWQYGRPEGSVVFDFRMGADGRDQRNISADSKAYCRPTVMWPTRVWAVMAWCMLAAGPLSRVLRYPE
jgi:transposase